MVLELTEEQIIENSRIANYHCPRYEELPKMYVYMDQLLTILDEYLSPFDIESEDKNMTAAMINSYVKKGIIPSPTNKKYSTVHIVYLIVLGTLKNVLSLSTIEKLIKMQAEASNGIREKYVDTYSKTKVKTKAKVSMRKGRGGRQ